MELNKIETNSIKEKAVAIKHKWRNELGLRPN
jgi:hypothetical protein